MLAAGYLGVIILDFSKVFGALFRVGLLVLVACQIVALLPLVGVSGAGRIRPPALSFLVRFLGMMFCAGSALTMGFGSVSFISHHGLTGIIAPAAVSGVVDETGTFHSLSPSVTVLELLPVVLLIACQVWGP